VRSVIITEYQVLSFIHILVTIFHFSDLFSIDHFYKLEGVPIFKNELSADEALLEVVNLSGQRI